MKGDIGKLAAVEKINMGIRESEKKSKAVEAKSKNIILPTSSFRQPLYRTHEVKDQMVTLHSHHFLPLITRDFTS